ncbi:MAG: hypothetical protein U5J82_10075 [Desulfobacterales bacterium]|nr:hypothetical protein [Desulfobacterales bacterium]
MTVVDLTVVAEDPVQGLQAQVPPPSLALQAVQELDALDVVVEIADAVAAADGGEDPLAVMPEGGMADIVA